MRTLIAAMILAAGSAGAAADDPGKVAEDFCYAVAAQALCDKTFIMPKGTEGQLEALAGQKLRGKGKPLNASCEKGYNAFYGLESAKGLESACAKTLTLYGPQGTRRAGLVTPRGKPQMKLPEAQVAAKFKSVCYAEAVAKACPALDMAAGHDARLTRETGVPAGEKLRYFSKECGSGTFRASLAKGKTTLDAFCAAGHARYGSDGSELAGLLVVKPGMAAPARQAKSPPPALDAKKMVERARAAANKAIAQTVDQICGALATSRKAADLCAGVSAAAGLEDLLQVQLGDAVGKVAERCAKVQPPAVGDADKAAFCRKAIADYGPKGRAFPNMLVLAEAARPSTPAQARPAAGSRTKAERVILDAVPPRRKNTDPVALLGAAPGTLGPDACRGLSDEIKAAKTGLAEASSLKSRVEMTVRLVASGMVGQALCPAGIRFTPPTDVVAAVKASGLEACHIVEDEVKGFRNKEKAFHKERRYRAILALNAASVWAYETFQPVCTRLMTRRVQQMLKFARDNEGRNSARYECFIWSDFVRQEMQAADALARERRHREAIAQLDTRVLAGLHGLEEHCDEKRNKFPRERWLSTRKRYQLSLKP